MAKLVNLDVTVSADARGMIDSMDKLRRMRDSWNAAARLVQLTEWYNRGYDDGSESRRPGRSSVPPKGFPNDDCQVAYRGGYVDGYNNRPRKSK